jgi:hypothetical protein
MFNGSYVTQLTYFSELLDTAYTNEKLTNQAMKN